MSLFNLDLYGNQNSSQNAPMIFKPEMYNVNPSTNNLSLNQGLLENMTQNQLAQNLNSNSFNWGNMNTWLGGKNADGTTVNGILPVGLGAMSGLMNAWSGMQQLKLGKEALGLQKDNFQFQKDTFNKNWKAQTQTLNTRMADRQNARVAFDSRHQDTSTYMKENEVK